MNKDTVKQIEDMCVDIFAHAQNDYEVTLSGNGTNPCEASAVAWAILDIIHGNGRKWEDRNRKRIDKAAKDLRAAYGEED